MEVCFIKSNQRLLFVAEIRLTNYEEIFSVIMLFPVNSSSLLTGMVLPPMDFDCWPFNYFVIHFQLENLDDVMRTVLHHRVHC